MKLVLDGKSRENLETIFGIQFFFLVFLSFWTVCAYPKLKQHQKLRFRERLTLVPANKNWLAVLGNKLVRFLRNISYGFLGEIRHRFWGNPSGILRKSVTDF